MLFTAILNVIKAIAGDIPIYQLEVCAPTRYTVCWCVFSQDVMEKEFYLLKYVLNIATQLELARLFK